MYVQVLLRVSVVVACMLVVATAVIVGRHRLRTTVGDLVPRLRAVAPVVVVLASALLFNGVARQTVPDLSWILDWNFTWVIYDFEGGFIVWLQSFEHPVFTAYFSFIYIYGYVFMLIFPVIAYLALSDTRPARELFAAYTLNYVLGLFIYVIVIAYGPRNVMPEVIEPLLYDTYPRYQHLTRQVNRNTNVFPSLHTSLAVTVSLLAYRTRAIYPRWNSLAGFLGLSVAISTMYLGIHWAIDVVAGALLAWIAVWLSARLVGRFSLADAVRRYRTRSSETDAGRPPVDTAGDTTGEEAADRLE
ncbi:phosphatase PAP2 family protein [Natronobiforma cellulositropha]|uniref:phosphatase PAP2 family protein n=1 Tax=Natronobiforma cellulositropha TaxID=1679076 RepID=UPI0021D5AB03|nr:phosphatase PAP2 family protein [Natronobiforma cellulositropha]